jgi:hypothetical protein
MCNPLYDIPRLLRLYVEGQLMLDELITRRCRLDGINQGYQDIAVDASAAGLAPVNTTRLFQFGDGRWSLAEPS